MTTHVPTAQPWTMIRKPTCYHIQGPNGETIAYTGSWLSGEREEMHANAALLFKAWAIPMLVEALTDLTKAIRTGSPVDLSQYEKAEAALQAVEQTE